MEYYIHLTISIFVFITGLMFGSFFTLATYRIPRKIDIVRSRSYCPNCKHKLGFFDCFPILSYISTIGRCRYCKRPISIRYPLIELASGLVFLILYLVFGFNWQFILLVIAYVYAVLIVGVDVMRYKMTDEEKAEVQRLKEENKRKKLDKKKRTKVGALNSEILIALVVFVIFFVSTIFTIRNYYSNLVLYSKKSEALNICMNKLNEHHATLFEDLASETGTTVVGTTTFSYNIEVSDYIKQGNVNVETAKIIECTVSFGEGENTQSVSLRYIKVDENE